MPGERAFARLKQWRILCNARCSTDRIDRTFAAIPAIEIACHSGSETFSECFTTRYFGHALTLLVQLGLHWFKTKPQDSWGFTSAAS
ncbi:hypothetical protein [Streptomyces sp. NPDC058086]|uniref:hypothetical protein n=1 Tax=Streptomyces sp. NPDC058086 TaxID=3346334 RepID=UPI0036E3F3E6